MFCTIYGNQEKDCLALLHQELNTKPINLLQNSDVLTEGQWVPKKWQTSLLLRKEGVISSAGHLSWTKINLDGNRLENAEPFSEKMPKSPSPPRSIALLQSQQSRLRACWPWKSVVLWGASLHPESGAETLAAKSISLAAQKGTQL